MEEEADAAEEAAVAASAGVAAVAEATAGPAKCTRQPAPTAEGNAKFHSSRPKEGRFTAGTASRSTKNSEGIFWTIGLQADSDKKS